MKNLKQWVDWTWKDLGEGKKTKIPTQKNGKPASSTDPKTWTKYKKTGKQRGFVLTIEDPYILVDLDHCYKKGKPNKWAKKIIKKLKPKYIDVSPSGDGLHLFFKGRLPENHKKKPKFKDITVEVYQEKRFVTMPDNPIKGKIEDIAVLEHSSADWLLNLTHREDVSSEYDEIDSGKTVKQIKAKMKKKGTWPKESDGIDDDGSRWGSDSDFKFLNQIADAVGVADIVLICNVYRESKVLRDKVENRIEYHVNNMLRSHEWAVSLGGEKVTDETIGADLPKPELNKEGLNEDGIKKALVEASKDGAYALNEMKLEIKEQTGLTLGVLDKMVKEEVASSLDEYFDGHICWDSVRGTFMEVGKKGIRSIKKANFNQTVMSSSGWMTPSDVGEVLHGAENVCSEYRPDVDERYFKDSGCSGNKLNLYFDVKARGKGKKIPKLVNKVLDNLFLNDPDAKEYFIHWMAYIIQTGKRTGVAWGFHGAETGTGKGLIVDVLTKMLGVDNCSINVGNDQLSEKFTGYADCKQLIHFNEIAINAQSRHQIAGKLKALISDMMIQLRLMGTDTFTVPNYANVILNSNKHNPLELEANDRRWNIINTESKLERLKWWKLGSWDAVMDEALEFKAWLLNFDVNVKMATSVMKKSQAKQNIIEATTSSVELLAQLVNSGGDVIEFLGVDKKEVPLYDELKWATKRLRYPNELLLRLYIRVTGKETSSVVEMNRFFKKPYIRGVVDVFKNKEGKTVRGVIFERGVTVR